MEITPLLEYISKENISQDELEQAIADTKQKPIDVPTSITVDSALKEIQSLTERMYSMHESNKRDPLILTKLLSLVELKVRLLGMNNVKPEMQDIIDAEINSYKKRVVKILLEETDDSITTNICNRLASEGL